MNQNAKGRGYYVKKYIINARGASASSNFEPQAEQCCCSGLCGPAHARNFQPTRGKANQRPDQSESGRVEDKFGAHLCERKTKCSEKTFKYSIT